MQKDNVQDQINELKEQNRLLWQRLNSAQKRRRYLVLALVVVIPLAVFAASIPNTFVDGEIISAAKINANFQQALSADCPSGFTKITAQNETLGCIQNTEQGNALCTQAINTCYTTFGGRLPDADELYIAFNNFSASLSDIDSAEEMTNSMYGEGGARCVTLNDTSLAVGGILIASGSADFRCFIPR